MTSLPSNHRRRPLSALAALACCLATSSLRAQAPDVAPAGTPVPAKPRYAGLENELAMYSPFESPWAQLKADHLFETHLFNLLRAEVRVWTLQSQLAGQDGAATETADEISRIIHAQVLAQAAEAVPLLEKTPNRPFASLLVHQLEAYPYDWKEEGTEEVLPNLRKLLDPPVGKPVPEPSTHRRRRIHTETAERPTPAASAAAVPR